MFFFRSSLLPCCNHVKGVVFYSANVALILSFIHMHMPFDISFLFDDTIKVTN